MTGNEDKKYASIAETAQSFEAGKRLFIGLIAVTGIILALVLVLLWIVPFVGLGSISPALPWVWGLVTGAAIALVLWASLGLILNVALHKPFFFSNKLRGLAIKLFLPLMILLGRALKIPKQKIRSSFIKVNNELVQTETGTYDPEKILLLMPHCLQNSRCKYRLTYNIENCKRCGMCPMAGLLKLRDYYGVHLAIATGGTIARRIVVQTRPKMIIAVACERDLSSGIQDIYPLPAYGVLNQRPKGPCLDTLVPLNNLEAAMRRFISPDRLPTEPVDWEVK